MIIVTATMRTAKSDDFGFHAVGMVETRPWNDDVMTSVALTFVGVASWSSHFAVVPTSSFVCSLPSATDPFALPLSNVPFLTLDWLVLYHCID